MAVGKRARPGLALAIVLAIAGLGCTVGSTPAAPRTVPPATGAECPEATSVSGAAPAGLTVGYGGLSGAFPFVQDVNGGLVRAAACFGVELVVLDTAYDAERAVAVAETLVARGVDAAIVFQTDGGAAGEVCGAFEAAGVPVVAIEVPHPCTVLFGANDAEAGRMAGERLVRIAAERWSGEVDALVVLEMPASSLLPTGGPLVGERAAGVIEAVSAGLPALSDERIVRVDGHGTEEGGRTAMAAAPTRLADADRLLVAAVNDPSAVGALRAIEGAGREGEAIVVGQGATIEARDELCAGTPAFAGSVGFFPDRYGDRLIPLAIDLARGREVPSTIDADLLWIDKTNVERYYPGECG